MKKENKLNSYSMQELAPVICEFLGQGKKVIIRAKGNSMLPLIRNLKDRVVLSSCRGEDCSVGDAVMYRRQNGQYVLHRIVGKAQDGSFVFMGDGQTQPEEGIKPEQIIAKTDAIYRAERYISCQSPSYKKYASFWAKSTYCRKLYLKQFSLRQKIKQKIKKIIG